MQDFDRNYLEELVTKWKDGTLTQDKQAYYDRWYQSHDDSILKLPEGYVANPIVVVDRIHDLIKARIHQHKKQKARTVGGTIWKLSIAAAILLSCVIMGYCYFRYNCDDSDNFSSAIHLLNSYGIETDAWQLDELFMENLWVSVNHVVEDSVDDISLDASESEILRHCRNDGRDRVEDQLPDQWTEVKYLPLWGA